MPGSASTGPSCPRSCAERLDSLSVTASALTVARGGAPATRAATPAPEPAPPPGDGGVLGGLLDIVTGGRGCSAPRVGDPAAVQGARLSDVVLAIEGLSTSGAHHADHVTLRGTLPWAEVDRMAGLVVGGVSSPSSSALQEGAAGSPGTAILRGTICGQGVGINLSPAVTEAGGVSLTVTSVSWAGREVPADQSVAGKTALEWLGMGSSSLGLPADALPAGFRVTSARVGGGGIDIRIEASDTDLPTPTVS
ncbi:LmeA family phospholipid-binding protein [Actinomyces timonensis]|uniref:LmeA family phospholipid-binding protein n=1 Tax=Actinomyces timonensis TaxID=1288391 RepID=A0AAU8N4N0_9ACTO